MIRKKISILLFFVCALSLPFVVSAQENPITQTTQIPQEISGIQPSSPDPNLKKINFTSNFLELGILGAVFLTFLIISFIKKYRAIPRDEALRFGREKTRVYLKVLPAIVLVALLVRSSIDILKFLLDKMWHLTIPNPTFTALSGINIIAWVSTLGSLALGALLTMGLIRISFDILAGKSPSFKGLFSEWKLIIPFLIAQLLYAISVGLGILLFMVPGMIFLFGFLFWPYILVDQKCSSLEALKRSWRLTQGKKWELFLFVILLAALNVVGVFILGVGLLITISISLLAIAYVYRSISGSLTKSSVSTTTATPLAPKKVIKRTPPAPIATSS